jgi:hypothetical protein
MRSGRALAAAIGSLCVVATTWACSPAPAPLGEGVQPPPRELDGPPEAGRDPVAPRPDAAVDAGAADAPADAPTGKPACEGALDCERVLFVTSATYDGNLLGGIAGATSKCNQLASAVPALSGLTFRAFLGTRAAPIASAMPKGTKPYRLVDGTQVATSFADLTDGTLSAPIDLDEAGKKVTGEAWSGANGSGGDSNDCDAWTRSGNQGSAGAIGVTTAAWLGPNPRGCRNLFHLYCVEE